MVDRVELEATRSRRGRFGSNSGKLELAKQHRGLVGSDLSSVAFVCDFRPPEVLLVLLLSRSAEEHPSLVSASRG